MDILSAQDGSHDFDLALPLAFVAWTTHEHFVRPKLLTTVFMQLSSRLSAVGQGSLLPQSLKLACTRVHVIEPLDPNKSSYGYKS